ncbi:hypothetical protein MBLNU230_g6422t1 [Neophaeotheca triangularis]
MDSMARRNTGPFMDESSTEDSIATNTTEESEGTDMYDVEKILCEADNGEGQVMYLVLWDGYPLHRATYEPAESFPDDTPLQEWRDTKERIARGEEFDFDPNKYEAACFEAEDAREKRLERRKAKRRKRERKSVEKQLHRSIHQKPVESSDDDQPLSKVRSQKKSSALHPRKKGVARKVQRKQSGSEDSDLAGSASGTDHPKEPDKPSEIYMAAPVARMTAPVANMGGPGVEAISPPALDQPQAAHPSALTRTPFDPKVAPASSTATKASGTPAETGTGKRNSLPSTTSHLQEDRVLGKARGDDRPPPPSATTMPKTSGPRRKSSLGTEKKTGQQAQARRTSLGNGEAGKEAPKFFRTPSQRWHAEKRGREELAPPDPDYLPTIDPRTGKVTPAKKQPPKDPEHQFPSVYSRRSPPRANEPVLAERQQSPPRPVLAPPAPEPMPPTRSGNFKMPDVCHFWQIGRCRKNALSCKFFHMEAPKQQVTCRRWKKNDCLNVMCQFAHTDTGIYSLSGLVAKIANDLPKDSAPPYAFGGSRVAPETSFDAPDPVVSPPPAQTDLALASAPKSWSQLGSLIGGVEQPAPAAFAFGGGAPEVASRHFSFNAPRPALQAPPTQAPPARPPSAQAQASLAQAPPTQAPPTQSPQVPAPPFQELPGRVYSKHKEVWGPAIWNKCPVVDLPAKCPTLTEEQIDNHVKDLDMSMFLAKAHYSQDSPERSVLLMYPLSDQYHMKALATRFSGAGCRTTMVSDIEHYKKTWTDYVSSRVSGIVVLHPEWDTGDLPSLGKFLEKSNIQFFTVGITTGYNMHKDRMNLTRYQRLPQPDEYYNYYSAHRLFPGGDITLITDTIFAHYPQEAIKILVKFQEVEDAKPQGSTHSQNKIATRPFVHVYLHELLDCLREREGPENEFSENKKAPFFLTKAMDRVCHMPNDMEYLIRPTPEQSEDPSWNGIIMPKKDSNLLYASPHQWLGQPYHFPVDFVKEPVDEIKAAIALLMWFSYHTQTHRHLHRNYFMIVSPDQFETPHLKKFVSSNAAHVQLVTPEMWLQRMDARQMNQKERDGRGKREADATAGGQ